MCYSKEELEITQVSQTGFYNRLVFFGHHLAHLPACVNTHLRVADGVGCDIGWFE